jgi:isoquinoline 1-oxidoreductase beta subunit
VLDVVDLGNAVAVVAEGYWQAEQALEKVTVNWNDDHAASISQEDIFTQFQTDLDNGDGGEDMVRGDAPAAFANADRVVEAEYRVPYLAHACMEPLSATARIEDGLCEVWVGSQNPLGFRAEVASALEMPGEQVKVYNHYMGGGGLRGQDRRRLRRTGQVDLQP